MNEDNNTDTYATILAVLDRWKHSQVNMQSQCAREMLAKELSDEVDKNIKQIVEDICCGG